MVFVDIKKVQQERSKKIAQLQTDPFVGHSSLKDAVNDCKVTSQTEVLARLLNRENLFISGMAGSGKTTIINRFIDMMDAEFDGMINIAITASTGIAATLLGGKTIHSWSGLGISTEEPTNGNLTPFMLRRRSEVSKADVLIIDEISMLPAYFFRNLNKWCQMCRHNNEPFGGLQIVLIGDFLQLPPVESRENEHLDNRFAIETRAWHDANITYCFLDKTYRAKDTRLQKLLLEIAQSNISSESRELIVERRMVDPEEDRICTTLFTTNQNVDKFNQDRLDENPNPVKTYQRKRLQGAERDVENLIKSNNIPEKVELKVGATVIITKNMSELNVVNGSIGVVKSLGFGYVNVHLNDGRDVSIPPYLFESKKMVDRMLMGKKVRVEETVAAVEQIPMKLGYAITVHKSQGQTFDGVVVDLSRCFTKGLGYVALSRVRSMDDLFITDINDKAFDVNEQSKSISGFVRREAAKAHKKFMESESMYNELLVHPMVRAQKWDKKKTARTTPEEPQRRHRRHSDGF